MNSVALEVKTRKETGKNEARRIRAAGMVPAVLYGRKFEPVSLKLNPDDFMKALDNPYKTNTLFLIKVDKEEYPAVVQDIAQDPVTGQMLHVDFYAIPEGEAITFKVPLRTTGRSIGIQLGGTLFQLRREIPVKCLIENLPESIEMDITELNVGDQIMVSDLPVLEGVEYLDNERTVLIQVKVSRAVEEDVAEEEEGEEAEGEEAAAAEGEQKEKAENES